MCYTGKCEFEDNMGECRRDPFTSWECPSYMLEEAYNEFVPEESSSSGASSNLSEYQKPKPYKKVDENIAKTEINDARPSWNDFFDSVLNSTSLGKKV